MVRWTCVLRSSDDRGIVPTCQTSDLLRNDREGDERTTETHQSIAVETKDFMAICQVEYPNGTIVAARRDMRISDGNQASDLIRVRREQSGFRSILGPSDAPERS